MNTFHETMSRMSKVLALASVVVASLSYTHIAGAAQVTVSAVFDSYTGPAFQEGASGINGTLLSSRDERDEFWFYTGRPSRLRPQL